MALPLGGSPRPLGINPSGSTPPTLSGMGQGSCSFDYTSTNPQVVGYGSDPAVQMQQGQLDSSRGNPSVAPSQTDLTGNPN